MKNKKIDDLFREKIPRGEKTPPDEVWEKIDSQLTQNQKKKFLVIPLWYKIAGVAAAFVLIFTLVQKGDRPVINTPYITDQPSERDKTEDYTDDNLADPPTNPESIRKDVPGTVITETHSEDENHNDLPNTSTYGRTIENYQGIKPLRISFKTGKRIVFSSSPSGNLLASNNPSTEIKTLKRSDKFSDEAENLNSETKNSSFKDRLRISPTIAAVYFGKIGDGNALDDKFLNNSSSGRITMAYGFSMAYQISDKVRLRSGVNNVNLSSDTRNVDNFSAVSSKAVEGNPAGIVHIPRGNGTLNQQLEYLEIPLELEYSLVEEQLGINLIAGFSTFFLQENQVTQSSPVFTADLGPSNNLNTKSFSINMGVGLQYQFSPKFNFKLDPVFKYQLQTYEDVSNLKPYHFGLFSGFHFKF